MLQMKCSVSALSLALVQEETYLHAGILQEAMGRGEYWRLVDSQGRPPGLLGMWPSRAVSFIENHDTGSTLNHWPFPHDHLHEGYAYIMTHPGTPCIFWDHFWAEGLGESIRSLINVRRSHNLQCRSKVHQSPLSLSTVPVVLNIWLQQIWHKFMTDIALGIQTFSMDVSDFPTPLTEASNKRLVPPPFGLLFYVPLRPLCQQQSSHVSERTMHIAGMVSNTDLA